MKKIGIAFISVICFIANADPLLPFPTNAPTEEYITVLEGQSFVWSFSPSDFSYEGIAPPQDHQFSIYTFWDAKFDNTDSQSSLHISFFEDTPEAPSFDQALVSFVDNDSGFKIGTHLLSNPVWSNMTGSVLFESIEKDTDIRDFRVRAIVGNKSYTASIPEPNSVALLIIGAGALILRRKNSNQRVHSIAGSARSE